MNLARADYMYEVDESDPKFAIDNLTPGADHTLLLYHKHLKIYQDFSRFWRPRMEVAKKCHNFMRREIFTPAQRLKYLNEQDKWPIEPQEMKPVINSLTREIIERVKSFVVTTEDETPPETAASPDVVNITLKWLWQRMKLKEKSERLLREGLIDGYPQWVMIDRQRTFGEVLGKPSATLLPWDCTLCTPRFSEADGSDIHELMVVRKRSKAELLAAYPHRKSALQLHEEMIRTDPGLLTNSLASDNSFTAEDRNKFIYDMVMASNLSDENGLYTTVEFYYSVNKKQNIYINDNGDPILLPEEWTPEQVEQWRQENPEFSITHVEDYPTLYYSCFSTNGFYWEHGQHWFQRKIDDQPYAYLNAIPFVASLEDQIPTGYGEDMLPYVLLIAGCATEGFSQVRKGTGTITFFEEGSVRHPSTLRRELSDENGVVVTKKGAVQNSQIKIEKRTPNETFFNVEDRYRNQLRMVHMVNEQIMGMSAPRQSAVAKDREIEQGMSPQSPYVMSYTHFQMNLAQRLIYMFPYWLKERTLVEIDDEFGNHYEAVVNEPTWDFEGNAANVINDLTAVDYRLSLVPGDDSATSREQELKDFVQIMEAIGNSVFKMLEISPRMVAGFLASWQNRFARETAKWLMEHSQVLEMQQQQQAQLEAETERMTQEQRAQIEREKIRSPKVNFKISPEDVQTAPMGFQVMMAMAQRAQQGGVGEAASPPPPSPADSQSQMQPQMQPQEGVV